MAMQLLRAGRRAPFVILLGLLVVAVALFGYLLYALLRGEDL